MSMFKPLLAETLNDTSKIPFPVLASTKLDGIRAIVKGGVVYSRSMKPIRNEYVQQLFGWGDLDGLDGELIVGDPTAEDVYRVTNSGVMSQEGAPYVKFYAFDRWDLADLPFVERESYLEDASNAVGVVRLPQRLINNEEELLSYEKDVLALGYEGVMLRKPDGLYKFGRSTAKEFILMKLKRFTDSEYKVIGFQERMHNANEATINELGHTERSAHMENMVPRGDLGALVLEMSDGQVFNCGTGFDDETRKKIWQNRDYYLGKWAKIKSFLIGVKDLPRFPVWVSFRDKDDM